MAYLLNNIDFFTYGITAGHAPGGNIALQGCFDLPMRIGKTYHDWGDSHSIEPYVASGEIFFAGRDIVFYGSIQGTNAVINTYLESFYTAIKAFTGLVIFSTPYGDFSVQIKSVNMEYLNGGAFITIIFREPVVTLTGGELPAVAENSYTIDGIPMLSFGLYVSKAQALHNLPELKEQLFTKYGEEGYQIVMRKHNILELNGFIIADGLSDFQDKIKALYLLFSSTGTRTIDLNYEKTVVCFATEGFKIENVYLFDSRVVANFKMSLLCESVVRIIDFASLITGWTDKSVWNTFISSGANITSAINDDITSEYAQTNDIAVTPGAGMVINLTTGLINGEAPQFYVWDKTHNIVISGTNLRLTNGLHAISFTIPSECTTIYLQVMNVINFDYKVNVNFNLTIEL